MILKKITLSLAACLLMTCSLLSYALTPKNIVLIGPPNSGKGTQASRLSDHHHLPKYTAGDLLRKEVDSGSEQGQEIKALMMEGQLVPAELIFGLLEKKLRSEEAKGGFILDGYPRNVEQAKMLDANHIPIHYVFVFKISNEDVLKRAARRWIHAPSGRTYDMAFNPPKQAGFDDITHEPLTKRADDSEETVLKRLQSYEKDTMPVVAFYREKAKNSNLKFVTLDATDTIEHIAEKMNTALNDNGVQ